MIALILLLCFFLSEIHGSYMCKVHENQMQGNKHPISVKQCEYEPFQNRMLHNLNQMSLIARFNYL